MLGIPGWEQDGIADRVVQRGWEHWEQWNEAISSCSILPIVQSWPAQSHCCSQYLSSHPFPCTPPGRGTWQFWCHVCLSVTYCTGCWGSASQTKPLPSSPPRSSPAERMAIWGKLIFCDITHGTREKLQHCRTPWAGTPGPMLPGALLEGRVPNFPADSSSSLFGKGGIKMGKSGICCSYLQLRNVRAVKLISWWNFPL